PCGRRVRDLPAVRTHCRRHPRRRAPPLGAPHRRARVVVGGAVPSRVRRGSKAQSAVAAQRVPGIARPADRARQPCTLRPRGDEFAVLLATVRGPAAAHEVATRLLEVFREPFTLDSLPVELEASIGVAVSPEHGTNAASLLQRADIAMYVAKRAHTGAEIFSV